MIFNIVILFLLIFSFPVVGPLNSAYIAVFLAIVNIVYKVRINRLISLFKNKYLKLLLIATFVMIILSWIWTKVLGSNDTAFMATFVSLFVGIIMVVFAIASLNVKKFDEGFIENLLIDVFVVQGLIEIAAFISPFVKEIVHNFQFEEQIPVDDYYNIFRGLALSGRLYFELAATCGLITILQFKHIVSQSKTSYIDYIKLFIVIIAGFFAGRTSMIGIVFGFAYMILYQSPIKQKLKVIWKLAVILVGCFILMGLLLPEDIKNVITGTLVPWLFDLIIKYNETGSTESSASFNMLNEMYEYVKITPDEWIFGSGRYVDGYGGYYKSVDGGYIRVLLYWGIIGSVLSVVYGLLYFIKPFRNAGSKNDKLFIIIIFLYTFFIHYKGEIAVSSRFYHVPLLIMMLPYVINRLKINRSGIYRYSNTVG